MKPNTLTLRAWYERHFVAVYHADADRRTIEAYQDSLRLWERLTGNPTLDCVTSFSLAEFRAAASVEIIRGKQIRSAATVNKHLRHVNHMFTKAGPPGPRNRDAAAMLDVAPWAKPLRCLKRSPIAPSMQTVSLVYQAAQALHNLNSYWPALIITAYNTGSRRTAVINLRDENIDWTEHLATFNAEHDKRGIERRKPLHSNVVSHLLPLRTKGLLRWKKSKTEWYRQWKQILDTACLTEDQRFSPHALKRTLATELVAIGTSEWVIRYMLDHSQRDVTGTHYVDALAAAKHAVRRLPQPTGKTIHKMPESLGSGPHHQSPQE